MTEKMTINKVPNIKVNEKTREINIQCYHWVLAIGNQFCCVVVVLLSSTFDRSPELIAKTIIQVAFKIGY